MKNSVGYDQKRGDSVTVDNFEFSPDSVKKPKTTAINTFIVDYLNPFLPFLKYMFAGVILFLFYKNFIAPFGEKMLKSYEELDESESDEENVDMMDEEDTSSLEEYNRVKKKIESELGMGGTLDQDEIRHEVLIEKVRKDIEASPEEMAKIIKSIVENE